MFSLGQKYGLIASCMGFKHHVMNVGGHQLYRGRIAITVEKVVDCEQSAFSLKIRQVRRQSERIWH